MATIKPREHAETYKKQKEQSTFPIPAEGTYVVVNTFLQFQTLKTGTRKLRATTRFLSVVSDGDKSWVGKDWGQDFWMNLDSAYNQGQLAHAGLACGFTEEWDPEKKADLVRAITGVPYLMTIKHEKSTYNGQERVDARVIERLMLGKDERKKFTDDPEWQKVIGEANKRFLSDRDFGKDDKSSDKKGDGGRNTPVEDDPFAGTGSGGKKNGGAPF